MTAIKVIVASTCLLVLAACTGGTGAGHAWLSSYYTQDVVRYAARDGSMLVTVHGDFGVSIKQVNNEIAKNMSLPGWFAPATFVAASPSAANKEHRFVFVINPVDIKISGKNACAATKAIPTANISEKVRIVAAFCAGDEVATELTETGIGGFPGDSKLRPQFLAFLDSIVSELVPARKVYVPAGN